MKALAVLTTALMLTLTGLAIAPAATAASPYPHTITTYCHAKAKHNPITRKTTPKMVFRITTAGNATPKASVFVKIIRRSDGKVIGKAVRRYNDPVETWRFKRLKPGRYRFHFQTVTGARSVYKNCSDNARLRVTR
jgi:hypothetical protein